MMRMCLRKGVLMLLERIEPFPSRKGSKLKDFKYSNLLFTRDGAYQESSMSKQNHFHFAVLRKHQALEVHYNENSSSILHVMESVDRFRIQTQRPFPYFPSFGLYMCFRKRPQKEHHAMQCLLTVKTNEVLTNRLVRPRKRNRENVG